MTENLAGRGEGLAGLVARERAWAKTLRGSDCNTEAREIERICDELAALEAAAPPSTARTSGCTASDDCIHECPVSEPESRLDEFKTTVIALWDPELTPEQKKAYIASRGKELREVAALATPSPQAPQRVRWTVEQNGRSERILCRWYEKDGIQLKREVAVFCDWNAAADIKWDEEDLVCTMNDYPRALAKSITSPEAQSLASLASEIVRGLEHRGHMDLYFNKDEAACAKEFVKEVMEEYLAVPHSGEVGVTQEPVGSGATLDLERSEGLYLKFSEPMMEPHTPVVIERVNGDCTVSQFIIARDEAHELINQLCEFLRVGSPRKVGEDGALRERLIALQLAHTTRYTARGNDMLWECSCGVPSKDLLGWDECHIATREHWADVMLAALSLSSPIEPNLSAILEHDRTKVAECLTRVKKALQNYVNPESIQCFLLEERVYFSAREPS